MFCRNGFQVKGEVRLIGAQIGGSLDFSTANLANPAGTALNAYGLTVGQDMLCEFSAHGEVNLAGAHIGGNLDCDGATLRNRGRIALNASRLRVDQGMSCGQGFHARGQVVLVGARIGGDLDCDKGIFRNRRGVALNAEAVTVEGSISCRHGFHAEGEVRLLGAHAGLLTCSGGVFTNSGPGRVALMGDRLKVDTDMFCRNGFQVKGEVRLIGAQIGGSLDFSTANLANPAGTALNAYGLTVGQDMLCEFSAHGEVNLAGAHIGGNLDCDGATLRNPSELAVDLSDAKIHGSVQMRPATLEGDVDLTQATVGAWCDEARIWPGHMRLLGFTYTSIDAQLAKRLQWLRHEPYMPEPYEKLAATYRHEGDDAAARKVLIEKQWRRRASHKSKLRRWPAMAWSSVLRATIGYGYRPWLVLWPMALLFLIGWWLLSLDRSHQLIVATTDKPPFPTFSAARYTADLLLPVANLGERAKFMAIGSAAWHCFVFTLIGWLLAIVLVAGLTGIFKHDLLSVKYD